MYEYLQGRVAEKSAMAAVLEIGGVGYHVQVPLSTFERLPAVGGEVRLYTHFLVREDAQALYGFLTREERTLFRSLISVSGIGPKVALTVLSGMELAQLKRAIVQGELPVLTRIPGIGKKTAERLVIELRAKIVLEGHGADAGASAEGSLMEDSLEALLALGYRKQNAKTAIDKVFQSSQTANWTVEELIRASLKYV